MFTNLMSNIVFTLYPIPFFSNNFVYKKFPPPSPYDGMKVFGIGIPIFEPLELSFLFQNGIFKFEEFEILSSKFMEITPI